ncbi:MAG: hypothetical protein K8F30_05300, partial [Taibaiella sp.]|nr:hypothetical protein [Taibaiella sp.]
LKAVAPTFPLTSVENDMPIVYQTYPEICQAIKAASQKTSLWCATSCLKQQAVRFAQYAKPDEELSFRVVRSPATPPRLVSHNPFALRSKSTGSLKIVRSEKIRRQAPVSANRS